MADKIFLDANILLDFFLKRNSYVECIKLFEAIHQRKAQAIITPSIIQITAHWLTKAYGTQRCKKLLQTLLHEVRVVDSSHSIIEKALDSKMSDVEDAIQYYTAIHHNADYFLTNDVKLLKYEVLTTPIISINQYLKKIQ